MKFSIISRGNKESNDYKEQLHIALAEFGMQMDEEKPDIVISIGGDGTLLHAFHRYENRLDKTAFVGLHTGHLGFYADWVPEEIDKLVEAIKTFPYQVIEYPLLDVTISYQDETPDTTFIALNESAVKSLHGTMVMDVYIKDEHFERFRGDGLCMSTPTGSTAYNKALGGAIVHPSLQAIQLAEVASINNKVFRTIGSPLLLPSHHTCMLKTVNNFDFLVTVDHLSEIHKNVETIQFKVSKQKIKFARYRPSPFWRRVHDSFITGHKEC